MIRLFRTYLIFSTTTLKQNYLAYKSRFLLWAISNSVLVVAQIFLYYSIYSNSKENIINGYDINQILLYILMSKIVESLTFVSVEQQIGNDIRSGTITISLIKPIKYQYELLFRSIGGVIGSTMLFAPIYIFIFIFIPDVDFSSIYIENLFLFLFFIFVGFAINFFISAIFASLIFKTIKYNGIYEVKKTLIKLLSGSLFPLTFYPSYFGKIIEYLPFPYLRYVPINVLLGKYNNIEIFNHMFIGVFWLIVLYLFFKYSFKKNIANIEIFGG